MTTQHTPLARIIDIVDDVERRGHALNELGEIRDIARSELAQRDALSEALKSLEEIASLINARQHAGADVRPSDWSEMAHCCTQARAALASVKGETK